MGLGIRSFLIDDSGAVKRVPWARMCRLFQGGRPQDFADCAGKRVRCAIVYLEFVERRPLRVLHTEFNVLHFDAEGSLDADAQSRQLRLIGDSIDGLAPCSRHPKVLDIRPRIARKLHREQFEWTPTEDELDSIIRKCL